MASALTLNIDETGWKHKGERRYLLTFVAPRAVFFHISPSRGAKVLREVFGQTFDGVITSDDHSAYSSYHKNGLHQLCWAHIIRKLKALREIDQADMHIALRGMCLRILNPFFPYGTPSKNHQVAETSCGWIRYHPGSG